MKGINGKAVQHIVERPSFLDAINTGSRGGKIAMMAETLKLMDRTKAICYDEHEFSQEFSGNKGYVAYMKSQLLKFGIKKPRVARVDGKVWIWKNDDK